MYRHLDRAHNYISHHLGAILAPFDGQIGAWLKQIIFWISALTVSLIGKENHDLAGVLLIFICLDCATGILSALKQKKEVSSSRLISTVYKILAYFAVIIAAHLVSVHFANIMPIKEPVKLVIGGYLAVEALSIFENVDGMGLPVPGLFKKAIKALKEAANDDKK